MQALRLLPIAFLLWSWALPACAEDRPDYQEAIAVMAPELRYLDFLWAVAKGDLNGDGIPDVAMLLTGSKNDHAPREERLVVLAGVAGGGYRILSVSGEFCHPSKFYDLDIKYHSLLVAAVETADSSRLASYTLRFRYSAKLNDLELVGEDTYSIVYDDGGEKVRTSNNYLTGKFISTTRINGRTKTTTTRIAKTAHPALNGWACRG